MIIPVLLFVFSILIILNTYNSIGDIVEKDVSLKGGITATVYTPSKIPNLKQNLENMLNQDVSVRILSEFGTEEQKGIIVEVSDVEIEEIEDAIETLLDIELTRENYSIEETGPSLGEAFYRQMLMAILFAFILMAITVFITFRTFIPSLAVVLSAFFDMIVTIALMNLFGIKLSTTGIAAILLLIGYSVDTDILLTTNLIKRKEGTIDERLMASIKTGLTMTITTIVALTIGYFVSNSFIIKQMFLIVLMGLFVDIIFTYIFNAEILVRYLKKKET